MIEINLVPEELKKKESLFKKMDISKMLPQNIPVLRIAIIVIGMLILLHVALFMIGLRNEKQALLMNKKYDSILPQKKEADALRSQLEDMTKKTRSLEDLMTNRFSWSKKLNSLSDSITPGIWLSELSYEEKAVLKTPEPKNQPSEARGIVVAVLPEKEVVRYLILSGYASKMGEEGTAVVGKFIKDLKGNGSFYSDFSEVELGSIASDKIDNQEVMNFKITCLFKMKK